MNDLFTGLEVKEEKKGITLRDIVNDVADLTILNAECDDFTRDLNNMIKYTVEAAAMKTIMVLKVRGLLQVEELWENYKQD